MPVATKKQSSPVTSWSVVRMVSGSRSWPASRARCRSSSSLGHSRAWITPPMHFIAHAAMMPSGVPPTPSSRSTPVSGRAAMIAPATSPSRMYLMRAPVCADLLDQPGVAGTVEQHDGDVVLVHVLGLGDRVDVLGHRLADVDDVGGLGAGDELLHVEHGRRVEHRVPRGDGHHRDGVVHALGRQRGAVDRVDRDVALGAGAVADLLAVEEHRRVVLLALADHDGAAHADRADHVAHRVDGLLVGVVLVAAADPAGGRHGRCLGDAYQFEGEVPVRSRRVAHGRDPR